MLLGSSFVLIFFSELACNLGKEIKVPSYKYKGNRQKVREKSFRKKAIIFCTKKVLRQKNPFIKKFTEIKSYQFETLFSRTFSGSSKKVPGIKNTGLSSEIHSDFFLIFFPGFFFKKVFLGLSYIDSIQEPAKCCFQICFCQEIH